MSHAWCRGILCLMIALIARSASAEVKDKTDAGFHLTHTVEVSVEPAVAYAVFHASIASWWDSSHTWSGDAANLSIDPKAGGLFLERLASGGSVKHMEVVFIAPARSIRLRGGLGPLQGEAVDAVLTVSFEASEGKGTKVVWDYRVGGYIPGGAGDWAEPVDMVLGIQSKRYARFCDTGKPTDE
ncbi:MAG TPA: SRPBCC family protein [Pirellulaceae bacterium]|nr:SRPBCC family protein [Pirellulaceae bacterium]